MARKVIKIGTSAGVTIPKEVLKEMDIKPGDEVVVEVDKENNKISYMKKESSGKRGDRVAELTLDFIDRYREDLKRLAEN